ncbi:MAG TPA: GAF domain-containing protein [Ohtaekwangia sp.]|uniref:GAF domain-containing protein n=1 Tax=Ohtaekwangia sp. TaxID=2066019 RepID=UPI002F95E124
MKYTLIERQRLAILEEKVALLESQIEVARNFVREIEKGNLEINLEHDVAGEGNSLALSLTSMRDQMKKIAEDEKQRNWITEGLARFVDILRTKNDNLKELAETVISHVVKYIGANQGALYVMSEDTSDVHLELVACYAYNRKKHIAQRFALGEGLAGQAVLEKNTIYMTNLPPDFVKITSGLGEALPRNLLIVPLILNDIVYGVVELASFTVFQNHHREFIERLAESIAATISAARVNQHTRKLLHESQVQGEQMRAQEEEMRQNVEELQSTQEQMQRVLKEIEVKEAYVNQLLNVSPDMIFTVDKEYKLVSWNKAFARSREQLGMRVEKGLNTLDWHQLAERENQLHLYKRVFAGETFEYTLKSILNGVEYHHLSIYAPLIDDHGNIYEAAVFAKDVTAIIKAQKQLEVVLTESQQKNEELSAQEEELRQNMEELQATQEAMIAKQAEIDRAREENERIKQEEAERSVKVGEMQKKSMLNATLKLKSKVNELEQMKQEMERVKQDEAVRAQKIAEMQKQAMNKLSLRLKASEEELKRLKSTIN